MENTSNSGKLSFMTKVGFSFGELGAGMVNQSLILFLLFYLTTYAGISPAAVGTMMLVARVWDAINDPLMGLLIDNTNTRWGKARPYLLFCTLPLAAFFIMCFAIPDISPTGKLVWLYVAYIGQGMLFTATFIPYNTLISRMTSNSLERVSLNVFRNCVGFISTIAVPLLTPMLVKLAAGPGNDLSSGYTMVIAGYAVLVVVAYTIVFLTVREKSNDTVQKKLNFKDGLKTLYMNTPFKKIAACYSIQSLFIGLFQGSQMFFILYYLKRSDLVSLLMPLIAAPMLLSLFFTKPLVAKLGKKKTAMFGLTLCLVGFGIRLITQDQYMSLHIVSILLAGFGMGIYIALVLPLLTDTVEYGQWKFGKRVESMAIAAGGFGMKLGYGLAAAIIGFVLEASGYVANAPEQSAKVMKALFGLNVVLPVIAIISIIVILSTYKIDDKMETIVKELYA